MTTVTDAPPAPERLSGPETAEDGQAAPGTVGEALGMPTADTDAPYGRTAGGRPRAKPGRKAKASAAPGAVPRRTSSRARTGPRAASRENVAARYSDGCLRLLRTLVAPLMVVGQRNPAVAADAATLAQTGPALAEAVGQLAAEEARVAAALDRLMSVGPYGEVGTVLLTIAAQLAYNHGALPPAMGAGMGLQDPAVLAAGVRRSAEQATAEAERKARNARGV